MRDKNGKILEKMLDYSILLMYYAIFIVQLIGIIMVILKALKIINCDWLFVFMPFIFTVIVFLTVCLLYIIVEITEDTAEKNKKTR